MLEDNSSYRLSPIQAQAILDLRLHRLTGMEHEKLLAEYRDLLTKIAEFQAILADQNLLMQVIRDELTAIRTEYADPRRSDIIASRQDFSMEDLIAEEDMVVTLSRTGYTKTQPLSDYRAQRRGGRGKSATAMKDENVIEHLLIASTHATLLLFSTRGKVYWLKVYDIPTGSRGSRGRPLVNLLPLEEGENITAILPVSEYREDHYIFMATAQGTVKKTSLDQFSRPRSSGLIALELNEQDQLVGAAITHGADHVMLFTSAGKAIRFDENQVRSMGRTAKGVRGIRLPEDTQVISLIIPRSTLIDANSDADVELEEETDLDTNSLDATNLEEAHSVDSTELNITTATTTVEDTPLYILTASENGYGKRTRLAEFPLRGRGGQGVIAMQCSQRNGALVSAIQVEDGEEMMLITDRGTLVRTRVDEVSITSRNTQGVTLIRLTEGELLSGTVRVQDVDADEDTEENPVESETSTQADNLNPDSLEQEE